MSSQSSKNSSRNKLSGLVGKFRKNLSDKARPSSSRKDKEDTESDSLAESKKSSTKLKKTRASASSKSQGQLHSLHDDQAASLGYAELLKLTPKEKDLIMESIGHCEEKSEENLGIRILNSMTIQSPELKNLMAKTLSDAEKWRHVRKFMDAIDLFVNYINDLDKLASRMRLMGARHAAVRDQGFRRQYFEIFRSAILFCVEDWMQPWPSHLKQTVRVWAKVTNFALYHCKKAYKQECRKLHRESQKSSLLSETGSTTQQTTNKSSTKSKGK